MLDPTMTSEKAPVVSHGRGDLIDPRGTGAARLYGRLRVVVLIVDTLVLEVAVLSTWLILRSSLKFPASFWILLAIVPPIGIGCFTAFGLYRLSHLSPPDEFRRILEAVAVIVVLVGLANRTVSSLLLGAPSRPSLSFRWLALSWLMVMVLVLTERQIFHKYLRRLRRKGELVYRTLIIGANDEAVHLAHRLRSRHLGFLPIGLVEANGTVHQGEEGLPILGSLADLGDTITTYGIECAFIASSSMRPATMRDVLQLCRRRGLEIRLSANMPEIVTSRITVQTIGDVPALSLRTSSMSGSQAVLKRSFDLVVGGIAMLVASPVWLVTSLLIKLTSKGPVLYTQERLGRHGKPFTIYKFRTMVLGADLLVRELEDQSVGSGPLFKIRDDPRLTPVGRLLRKWTIDELPQLLNVIKGDMSLVGPRPMPSIFDESYYQDWHLGRLEALPGITGLWQVSGRNDLSFDDCVRLDLFYIENWSIAYDLFILLKTVPAILSRRGAY